jgi:hypothetical protein
MRLVLGGPIAKTDPVVLVFTGSTTFDKTLYSDYTNYDVIAIGAGGGRGGGCEGADTNTPANTVRNYGGAGGGGGFHRVRGLLEVLGDSIDVTVGTPGSDGTDGTDGTDTTNGTDGTYSSFGDFCMASGGKGGKKVVSCSIDENMENDGGNGGLGGQIVAGHGAIGGVAGFVDPEDSPAAKGMDGLLYTGPYEFTTGSFTAEGLVGEGGGGGTGGIAFIPPAEDWRGHIPWATEGGRGSYNSDEAVFGSRGYPFLDPDHYMAIGPGSAGGARITPLNRSTKTYGKSGEPGVVAIRLTKE